MENDVFSGHGVRIKIDGTKQFRLVRETLERIGMTSRTEKILYPSCCLLHKKGQYAILHFKEMFLLDGKTSTLCELDIAKRNKIVQLLKEWKLIEEIVDADKCEKPVASLSTMKILPFGNKEEWEIVHKYKVGSIQNVKQ